MDSGGTSQSAVPRARLLGALILARPRDTSRGILAGLRNKTRVQGGGTPAGSPALRPSWAGRVLAAPLRPELVVFAA